MNSLVIKDLHANIAGTEIIRGLSLEIQHGKVHAIMGPNGSGKSTLAKVLGGHPDYTVTSGEVLMDGENILGLEPDERARKGLFLAFQYPMEIPGVTHREFPPRRRSGPARRRAKSWTPPTTTRSSTRRWISLEMTANFTVPLRERRLLRRREKAQRDFQMAMLKPRYAVLDETDSGLDIDALKIVSAA